MGNADFDGLNSGGQLGDCGSEASVRSDRRVQSLLLPQAGRRIELPCFFPSISSVKGEVRPLHALQVVRAIGAPEFLVSAYDIHHAAAEERVETETLLRECAAAGSTILLDSGQYESYWRSDPTWTSDDLARVTPTASPSLRFCFDDQDPPAQPQDAARIVIDRVRHDEGRHASPVVPIVHGTTDGLPRTCSMVAAEIRPLMVAVPERELGDGVLARAKTIRSIRRALDESGNPTPIHVLGTGHPISLLIYALYGADSFDGLEWTHSCADAATKQLLDFQLRDLAAPAVPLEVLTELPYPQATLVHNLAFYRDWMARIQSALRAGSGRDLLCATVPFDRGKPILNDLEAPR
jgi:queuine/archaeosine tRNA-ribosyltransferase